MHGNLPPSSKRAIDAGLHSQVRHPTEAEESDVANWFSEIAQGMLGKNPHLQLHTQTGFPESSCQCWVAGTRKVPGYVIVTLLRSPQGQQWLNAFMLGATAEWWKDHIRNIEIAEFCVKQRAEAKRLGLE